MKRFLCILCLLLALVCIFAACNEEGTPDTGKNDSTPAPVHTHTWGDWTLVTAPTCLAGSEKRICDGCNATEMREIAATGEHVFGNWATVTQATCGTQGSEMRVCFCGATDTRTTNETGEHYYTGWTLTNAPTCSAAGVETGTCTCGATDTREIAPTGEHVFGTDNKCIGCPLTLEFTAGLEYALNADELSYVVIGDGGRTDTEIIIPAYYEGKPVVGIDQSAFYRNATMQTIKIPNTVTSIGNGAFSRCSALKTVEIPGSVTALGHQVFFECEKLENVTMSEGVKNLTLQMFAYCTSLKTIIVPNSVTSIDSSVFKGCSALETITLPYGRCLWVLFGASSYSESASFVPASLKNVTITGGTAIPDNAFYGCSGLVSVTLANSITKIGSSAFNGCTSLRTIALPDAITAIFGNAFQNCTVLHSISFSNKLETIGYSAFYGCAGLTSITFAEGSQLTRIGEYAFYGCASLTDIEVPAGVTSIGEYAFYGCASLTDIEVPAGVTSIGEFAFSGCTGLESITLPFVGASPTATKGQSHFGYIFGYTTSSSSINGYHYYYRTYFGSGSNAGYADTYYVYYIPAQLKNVVITGGTSIVDYAFYRCSQLASITIPASATSIGNSAFYSCHDLTSVTFGEDSQLTNIGEYAFYNCTALTSVAIPARATNIDEYAFYKCTGLTSITIPASVMSIDKRAFEDCTCLTNVTFGNNSQLTSIGECAFYGCSGLASITIPASVTSIGNSAFYNCTGLTSGTFAEGSQLTSIGENAFLGCIGLTSVHTPSLEAWCNITFGDIYANPLYYANNLYIGDSTTPIKEIVIPNTVTEIKSYTFRNWNGTSITIPASVTSIGFGAFFGCAGLASITVPTSVTSIGRAAFAGCAGLASITLPFVGAGLNDTSNVEFDYIFGGSGVPTSLKTVVITGGTSIGNYAFDGCDSLTSITIPASVTSIGECAFYGCSGLTSITIPASVTSIGYFAFENCTRLTSVHTPSLEAWCNITFGNNTANPLYHAKNLYIGESTTPIKEIVIPNTVTNIKNCVLTGWNGTSITIPASVKKVGISAFYNCSNLTSIEIPAGVTSIGSSAFFGCTGLTNITLPFVGATLNGTSNTHFGYIFGASSYSDNNFRIPASLKTVTITGGTSIGKYAFYGCTELTSITLPFVGASLNGTSNTLFGYIFGADSATDNKDYVPASLKTVVITGGTSIGEYAFNGCANLTSITIPASVTSIGYGAFANCSALTSVAIPARATNIGEYAFYKCTGLTSITIPASVTSIGSGAFSGCTTLTAVRTPSLEAWCNITFGDGNANPLYCANNLYIGDSTTPIKEIVIPNTVTEIKSYTFCNWNGTSITIPASVTSIGEYAFYGCTSLNYTTYANAKYLGNGENPYLYLASVDTNVTTFEILNTTKMIGDNAFYNLDSLTGVIFAEGSQLTSIGSYAFSYCDRLASITIPASVKNIGDSAFFNCSSLTSIEIPAGVKSIGSSAFSHCDRLASITIPASVTSIGSSAFYECTGLTSVTFAEGIQLTSIGSYEFYGCSGLTSITIPASVTSIGYFAFENCTRLTRVTFKNTTGWRVSTSTATSGTKISATNLANQSTAATYLKSTYYNYYWKRTVE